MNTRINTLLQRLSAIAFTITPWGLLITIMLLTNSYAASDTFLPDSRICENQIIDSGSAVKCTFDYLYLIINKDFCVGKIRKGEMIKVPDCSDKYFVLEAHILQVADEVGYLIRLTPFDSENKTENRLQLPDYTIISSLDKLPDFHFRALPTEEHSRQNHIELAKYYASITQKKCITLITKDLYPCEELNDCTRGIPVRLTWKNTGISGCTIYASVWSEWDGTYLLAGSPDKNGTVHFDNYILRDAATVSLFVML